MERKKIKVDFEELLDTIMVANQSGIPWGQFAKLLGHTLTDAEIEKFATDLGNTEGYDEDDYHAAKEELESFRSHYIQPEKSTRATT